eukprot:107733-Prorocentrum_minimum.AAC.6
MIRWRNKWLCRALPRGPPAPAAPKLDISFPPILNLRRGGYDFQFNLRRGGYDFQAVTTFSSIATSGARDTYIWALPPSQSVALCSAGNREYVKEVCNQPPPRSYNMEQCMIFCRTNFDVDNLEQYLTALGGGGRFRGKAESGKENAYSCVVRPNKKNGPRIRKMDQE